MGVKHVVHGASGGAHVAIAWRVNAEEMAQEGDAPGFIDRCSGVQAIAEVLADDGGIVAKPASDIAIHPAALVLQGAGQVPVVERGKRLQPPLEHAVDQPIVEVEPGLIYGAGAFGDQPRPGQREAIAFKAGVADQVEILRPAIVVVAGHVAVVGVLHVAGGRRKRIPDGRSPPIGLATFDLIGSRGGAKDEIGPEILAIDSKHLPSPRGPFGSVDELRGSYRFMKSITYQ